MCLGFCLNIRLKDKISFIKIIKLREVNLYDLNRFVIQMIMFLSDLLNL